VGAYTRPGARALTGLLAGRRPAAVGGVPPAVCGTPS
jgi:hypothetical protein